MKYVLAIAAMAILAGSAFAQGDCCGDKEKGDKSATKSAQNKTEKAATKSHCESMASENAAAEQDECCKSTDAKPVKKGEGDCCNAADAPAKFKVYVEGKGYRFFGCEESANKARETYTKDGIMTGAVQKVVMKGLKIKHGVKA